MIDVHGHASASAPILASISSRFKRVGHQEGDLRVYADPLSYNGTICYLPLCLTTASRLSGS